MRYQIRWVSADRRSSKLGDTPREEERAIEKLKELEEKFPDDFYTLIPFCEVPIRAV